MPTIADHILDLLRQAGIDHVYCSTRCRDLLTGPADGPGRMRLITVPDGGAAIAACAEAQLTGRPAVCVGAGPGVLELIDGLAEAHHIGVPVVAVALADPGTPAGPGSRYRGSLAALPLFARCSAHVVVLDAPERTSQLLNSALHVARDAKDVAVLAVPSSAVGLDVAFRPASPEAFLDAPGVSVPAANVVQLAQMLNSAGRVAFLAGAGVRGARDELLALAGRVQAPIGHTSSGKEWIQHANPFDVGMSGLLGYGACFHACHECDLLVLVGTDLPYDNLPLSTRTVQIDDRPAGLAPWPPDFAIAGPIQDTLRRVLPLVGHRNDREFLDEMLRRHALLLDHAAGIHVDDLTRRNPIHPEFVASVIDELAAEDAVFSVDPGTCDVWAARYLTPNGRRRIIQSPLTGSGGVALVKGVAAGVTFPGRQIVTMIGDASSASLVEGLLAIAERRLPLKAVVFNGRALGQARLAALVGGPGCGDTATRLTDLAAFAAACDIPAMRIDRAEEVRVRLAELFRCDGPALADVRTDPDALVICAHVTGPARSSVTGSPARVVLPGGVGKLVDSARRNVQSIPALPRMFDDRYPSCRSGSWRDPGGHLASG